MAEAEVFLVTVKEGTAKRVDATKVGDLLPHLAQTEVAWVNVEVEDLAHDGERVAKSLGFSTKMVDLLLRLKVSGYEDRDKELGLRVPMIRVEDTTVHVEPLLVLLQEHVVLTIYQRGRATRFRKFARYAETALRKIPKDAPVNDKLSMVLTRLLSENNERNFDGIRAIQDQGEKLSGLLLKEEADRKRLAHDIYRMKRALILYLDALWASLDVIHYLRQGDAELVTDDETLQTRIGVLGNDIQRHIQLSEHMSEVLASGLEVMQSVYNNQLQVINNRMAFVITWLTILGTAVLVPNTIATVLGAAPEGLRIDDPIAYLAVMVGSTLLATFGAWAWIRLAVPLPRKMD